MSAEYAYIITSGSHDYEDYTVECVYLDETEANGVADASKGQRVEKIPLNRWPDDVTVFAVLVNGDSLQVVKRWKYTHDENAAGPGDNSAEPREWNRMGISCRKDGAWGRSTTSYDDAIRRALEFLEKQ